NEVFQFAIGTDATVQLYNGTNVNNGNTGADFPIVLLAALSDLSADGILSVTLSASSGDYRFTHSLLSAEITRGSTDSVQLAATAVPEPGTMALLGLGMLGMGLMRKRKS
ncbi:MAG TPA: PEP-CTERM sorting domain-containing protein, partial [Azonexus sp.]